VIGSQERTLSRYVKWIDYAGEDGCVVLLEGGGVFMLVALDCLPFETTPDEMINHRYYAYEAALRHGSQDGLTYGFLQCRGEADPAIYPTGEFRTEFAAGLDRKYRHKLFGTRSMWLNRWHADPSPHIAAAISRTAARTHRTLASHRLDPVRTAKTL
jgi:hypothetical protein